ncbi:sensor histidine kinase [Tepidibacillus infernus]|uniref:sensor histidine kinase n=1 Tax=Tepidibacillus TaxID=1494427 RepID=UPI00085337D7|nr:GHKL domain-containing protein [Tepidibacillus sp. HK-1]GBF10687.1 sensor histidine kinase DpiB [Tepidibacillus sp. HK-1]
MGFLINYLFISLPEFYGMLLLGTVLFGFSFSKIKYKILFMAIISAFISDLMWQLESFADFRIIITIIINTILYKLFIHKNWKFAFGMTLTSILSILISEIIVLVVITQFISYQQILGSFWLKLLVTFTYMLPLIISSYFIEKKHWSVTKGFKKLFINKNIAYWISSLTLILLQLFFIIYLNYSFYMNSQFLLKKIILNIHGLPLFSLGLVIVNILLIVSVIQLKNIYMQKEIIQTESDYNQHLENVLKKLRMERHDFINEIQTIHGMIQAKMYDHLQEYVHDLVQHVRASNRRIKIKNIPVSALLHTKIELMEEKKVEYREIVETDDTFPSIKGYDLVKIISNILDNALRAVTESHTRNPFIEIYWGKKDSTAIIQISNNGPKIEKKIVDLLFEEGYTTKKEKENSGFGLSIVKSIVQKYKGTIRVESSKNLTTFIIELPL